jgi:hypothetical protein
VEWYGYVTQSSGRQFSHPWVRLRRTFDLRNSW